MIHAIASVADGPRRRHPLDPATTRGPMASQTHLNRVLGHIDIANRSDDHLITRRRPARRPGPGLVRRVRTGTIGVDYYRIDRGTPFGGVKDSGIGREYGLEGLANYLSTSPSTPAPHN